MLAAMNSVPRHLFVEEALAHRAYENTPLPIGQGQTISQPYIVARMTELLRAGRTLKRVLEVGTGCGYQTAVLAQVAQEVYSVERIGSLLTKAKRMLREGSGTRSSRASSAAARPAVASADSDPCKMPRATSCASHPSAKWNARFNIECIQ